MDQVTSGNAWREEKRRKRTVTPLNARLDRAFQRCLDRGGHTPSGEHIVRDFGNHQRNLPICRSCRCPYGFPVIRSARNRWNGTNG